MQDDRFLQGHIYRGVSRKDDEPSGVYSPSVPDCIVIRKRAPMEMQNRMLALSRHQGYPGAGLQLFDPDDLPLPKDLQRRSSMTCIGCCGLLDCPPSAVRSLRSQTTFPGSTSTAIHEHASPALDTGPSRHGTATPELSCSSLWLQPCWEAAPLQRSGASLASRSRLSAIPGTGYCRLWTRPMLRIFCGALPTGLSQCDCLYLSLPASSHDPFC